MKKTIAAFILFCLLLSVVGCSPAQKKRETTHNYPEVKNESLNSGNKSFSIKLFKEINSTELDTNVFISPYSISSVLTMVSIGAGGNTKNEMTKTLGYEDLSDKTINSGQKYLYNHLTNLDKKITLDISNSVWIRDGQPVEQAFLDTTIEVYDAYVEYLDFSKDSAAKAMNDWISTNTNELITEVIQPPIDPYSVMFLINTIYFKGEWTNAFDASQTTEQTFTDVNNQESTVDMMHKNDTFDYVKTDAYRAVKLPYGDKNASMYCVLPEGNTDINDFISNFTLEQWKDISETLSEQPHLPLSIPKFKVEYGVKNLNTELKALGIETAFTEAADFSGISENLMISKVSHKAVIEVDEVGTKAAAATVVEMTTTAMPLEEPPSFIADRPFLFIIADDEEGTILFMGKIADL